MKYEENAPPREFPSGPDEYCPPAPEYAPTDTEFSPEAPELHTGGAEFTGQDAPSRAGKGRRGRGRHRQDRGKGLIHTMGYCVAAVASVALLGSTLEPEVPQPTPDLSPSRPIVTPGPVVENNSLSCVTSAVTGAGIQAIITVHADSQSGQVIQSVFCDQDGNFNLVLPEGSYVLEISAYGYLSEYFPLEVYTDETEIMDRYTLSPVLAPGQFRIVLEWGDSPSDLDSHLFGVMDDQTSFEVYFSNSTAYSSRNGADVLLVMLDRDDIDSYGPETTTIYTVSGSFTFKVHDYSNKNDPAATALGQSGATVKVYMYGSDTPRVFTVPQGAGIWWHVFDIDHGALRIVDQLSSTG